MCTYCDRCDADSGEHLFDQSVAIVERLHHQTLLSGDLTDREGETLNVSETYRTNEIHTVQLSVTYRSTVQALIVQQVLL